MNSDIQIIVSDEIRAVCPDFVGAALEAEFSNSPYSEALWNEIHQFQTAYTSRYTISSIKEMPSIQATRTAYKRCGKDPSRYRPSGEALVRRMLNGHDLYQINTAVDLKIQGHTLTLGIGKAGEPYEGIGRGPLNIEGLPVYRDTMGGIGTPTSDHERTKLSLESQRILAIVNGYDGNREQVRACAEFMQELLQKYAFSDGGQIRFF